MVKVKSSLKNMIAALFGITLGAGVLLAVIYDLTKETINISKNAKIIDAIALVLEEFDNNPLADTTTVELDGFNIKVHTARLADEVSGYAVETLTKRGYGGEIKIMVGFKPDGEIINIEVLQQSETPGLGSKMADKDNVLQVSFVGRNAAQINMKVTKDGGDIDCITASTISSRAYAEAVERAYRAYLSVAGGGAGVDKKDDLTEQLSQVLPKFDNTLSKESRRVRVEGVGSRVYTATLQGDVTGYAVEATGDGYGGEIKMLVGFLPEGEIFNIVVTEHSETEGFGAVIADDNSTIKASFVGRNPKNMKLSLKKNGGAVDAISASTISSQGYVDAVGRAYGAYLSVAEQAALTVRKRAEAVVKVLPKFDNAPLKEVAKVKQESGWSRVYVGRLAGEVTGYAVESTTDKAFGGVMRMVIGFLPGGEIFDITLIEHSESPGYGDVLEGDKNVIKASLLGKNPSSLKLSIKSDGGDIDAISGSTVSSLGYVDAVKSAHNTFVTFINKDAK